MKIGVVYPQIEYSTDPLAVRDYAQCVEGLGFSHVLAYDHVLGANPERPGGWKGPYTHHDPFMEPFVLFSYMAGLTRQLEFATGVIILPQRQTALVAKQAATLSVLCQGRLRLGVGIGWNEVEYIGLGENFHDRGRKIEEQILLLRELWREPLVTFDGKWHHIVDAGLNPLPVQGEIPVWIGGQAAVVLKRAAQIADGWMPGYRTAEAAKPALEQLRAYLVGAGREMQHFGIEARISCRQGAPSDWVRTMNDWEAAGATHISVDTMGGGLKSPQEHMDMLKRFAIEAGLTTGS